MSLASDLVARRFSGEAARICLAIGYAESGGYLDAVGDYYQIRPTFTVQPGDTLTALARSYRTTVETLVDRNRLVDPDRIIAGQELWNPSYNEGNRLPSGGYKWGPSVGWFQIRTLTDPKGWGVPDKVRDIEALRDPERQVEAIWVISEEGTTWDKWSVYRSEAYRLFLDKDYPLLVGHPESRRWNLAGKR